MELDIFIEGFGMVQHLNRLNNEEAAEFDTAFEEFCKVENEENKMNTDFYLTIKQEQHDSSDPRLVGVSRLYYMAIFNAFSPNRNAIFTSKPYSNKADLEVVGKAYAKRLNIIYRESDEE